MSDESTYLNIRRNQQRTCVVSVIYKLVKRLEVDSNTAPGFSFLHAGSGLSSASMRATRGNTTRQLPALLTVIACISESNQNGDRLKTLDKKVISPACNALLLGQASSHSCCPLLLLLLLLTKQVECISCIPALLLLSILLLWLSTTKHMGGISCIPALLLLLLLLLSDQACQMPMLHSSPHR